MMLILRRDLISSTRLRIENIFLSPFNGLILSALKEKDFAEKSILV
jgi:hypothetical protein